MQLIQLVMQLSWMHLRRDHAALTLTFLLPLIFFTVFASVFSDMDQSGSRPLEAGLVAQDEGVFTEMLTEVLQGDETLGARFVRQDSEATAAKLIAAGEIDALIVVPAGFEDAVDGGKTASVKVYVDPSNPLVGPAVAGRVMQAVIDTAAALSDEPVEEASAFEVEMIDAVGNGKQPSIAFFAAGLGVLFLMLSITNRAGMILDEKESGVLARMLTTRLRFFQFLFGRGLFFMLLGVVQISVMFVWAALAFGLDLPGHWREFTLLACLSAASASAFGLAVVTLCRTREQLTAVSTVLVLLLAAVGGSLFPRFLMPAWLEQLGWFTFNAWAVDGFQQVFWYDAPLTSLGRHALVLAAATVLLFLLAWWMGTRWLKR